MTEFGVDTVDYFVVESLKDGNIREIVRDDDFASLVQSVKTIGIIDPLTIYLDDKALYIKDGHRRRAAAIEAGLETVPCMIVDKPEIVALHQLVINEVRSSLTAIERATAMAKLVNSGMNQKDVAKALGKAESWVSQHLALLEAPQVVRDKIQAENLSYRAGYQLCHLPKDMKPEDLAGVKTVRQAQQLRRKVAAAKETTVEPQPVELPDEEPNEHLLVIEGLIDMALLNLTEAKKVAEEHECGVDFARVKEVLDE